MTFVFDEHYCEGIATIEWQEAIDIRTPGSGIAAGKTHVRGDWPIQLFPQEQEQAFAVVNTL